MGCVVAAALLAGAAEGRQGADRERDKGPQRIVLAQQQDPAQPPVEDAADAQAEDPAAEEPADEPAEPPAEPPAQVTPTRPPVRRVIPGQGQNANQAQPAQPPGVMGNPARPQTGEKAKEPISLDFVDQSLVDVLKAIGVQTGRNFAVDPSISAQKVTIISHHPVPADYAFDILEAILATKNWQMTETLDGNLVTVTPMGQNQEKMPMVLGKAPPTEGFDRFEIRVVNVENVVASEVASILQSVGSQNGAITVYDLTNTLIIKDTADGIRHMLELLKQIDVPGHDTSLELFVLEYTRAEQIAKQIQDVLLETGGGGGGQPAPGQPVTRTPTRVTRARPTGAVPGQGEPAVYGAAQSVLRMVPDERLNALIVVATEGLMEQVRYLINQLDQATPYEANTIRVKRLLNADAEAVEEVLSSITGGQPRAAAAAGGGQGGGGGGAQAAGEVQTFEKKITISRFEQTNSLVIVASPQDYKTLEPIIDQLDVPRRQVNVEAVIMEVTVNDAFELSVETAGLTANSAFALNNIANLARGIAGGPLAIGGPGTTFGIIDGTTQIPLPGPADPDTGLPGAVNLVTIPNVPLLMRTLETITNVEVLSQPNLMTLDNEEANITIGQEVPIIDTLADVNDRTGFNSRARVNRRDIGVIMGVTPQINEGDYVAMKIKVEVSAPVQSTVGIDPNEVGATFQKANVDANVVIPDGKTGIIGGLLRESVDKSVSQAPVLGDLPLLGFLFRAKKNSRNKQNVVILVSPHIVKEGHDLDRLTDFRMDEFYQRNIDVVFGKDGFIQKVKKKHQARNNNRPTDQFNPGSDRYIERDMDQSNEKRKTFGRGDIDR